MKASRRAGAKSYSAVCVLVVLLVVSQTHHGKQIQCAKCSVRPPIVRGCRDEEKLRFSAVLSPGRLRVVSEEEAGSQWQY